MARGRHDEEELARLIPALCEALPGPEQGRLDQIERRLLAQAPVCPQRHVRRHRRHRPWWVFGLWVAAASAAAWWGVGQWQASDAMPSATVQAPDAIPSATSVPHQSLANPAKPPGESAPHSDPERHSALFIFRK